jgi:hypothetical protein
LAEDGPDTGGEGGPMLGERLLFAGYLLVIVLGLALFLVAGLTHR